MCLLGGCGGLGERRRGCKGTQLRCTTWVGPSDCIPSTIARVTYRGRYGFPSVLNGKALWEATPLCSVGSWTCITIPLSVAVTQTRSPRLCLLLFAMHSSLMIIGSCSIVGGLDPARGPWGEPATLAEKLLCTRLFRVSHLIPGVELGALVFSIPITRKQN